MSDLASAPQSFVVELASNDGYLLQHFLPLGIPVLGIEPAVNVAQAAIAKGVPTRTDFFGAELATKLAREGRGADLIVGNNVLAQVPDLNDFVAGIKILLKPEGVVTLEFPHIARLIAETQFDTIYHEHFSYFSLTTTEHIAARHDLKIIDVEELATHGGSLRVYLAHRASVRPVSERVGALLEQERAEGLLDVGTYEQFGGQVKRTKRNLLAFLIEAKNSGKSICGYGAPGKGNTLLNYCGIGTDFLDFTVDRNPYKHGRFTPGMHIPILPPDAISIAKPDYILILPWNLRREIIEQMRSVTEWGGKFIVPIPEVSIVDPEELEDMKVVLFCGGLGTRIREYSENIPKPMVPVGNQPILLHVMQYYSQFGHKDFVLCLGYKANTIKEFFLNYRPQSYMDCVVSGFGSKVELLGTPEEEWRVAMLDTGIWRNIGQRLWAVRDYVKDEEIFLANYSDGLTDVNLDQMIETFKKSGKLACFLAVRPPLTYHLADIAEDGSVAAFRSSDRSDIWINGGYFIMRPKIFDYMQDGEELVLEPFTRLIADGQLMAYRHDRFWRSMDTLRDRQMLEDLVEQGEMPWRKRESLNVKRQTLVV